MTTPTDTRRTTWTRHTWWSSPGGSTTLLDESGLVIERVQRVA